MMMKMIMVMKMIVKLEIMKMLKKESTKNIKWKVERNKVKEKVRGVFSVKTNCWVVVSTTKNC